METLLGHLRPLVKINQEDIATLTLHYLLTKYPALNTCFTGMMAHALDESLPKTLTYVTQSAGDERERPDIAGSDASGKEFLLCEEKFYAGLTENQPLTYLKRLREEGGAGLVFICPENRKISLWAALLGKCGMEYSPGTYRVKVEGVSMALVSWEEILIRFYDIAVAVEPESVADIRQLKIFCEEVIQRSFTPFMEIQMGADNAKTYKQCIEMISTLRTAILSDPAFCADIKGLKNTPQVKGVNSYMRIRGINATISMNVDFWANETLMDTPFWLSFHDADWRTTPELVECFKDVPATEKTWNYSGSSLYLALPVPYYLLEDEAVNHLKKQILTYLSMIKLKNT